MSLKWILTTYFGVNILFALLVYIQHDETAKRDAIYWILFVNAIFLLGVLITWIRKKRGTQ